jgi:carboxyl-terminal processing protease
MKIYRKLLTVIVILQSTFLWAQPQVEQQYENDFEILKNLELFELVYKNIDMNYVDEPVPGELMKAAIDAMLLELDPYTTYIPESKIEDYKLMSTGQYGGIGAIIRQFEGQVMIVDPSEGFPAQKAGLESGDIFLEINDKSVEGLKSNEVSEKLKGKPGTPIKIKVDRNGEEITKEFMREEIKFSPVPFYDMIDDKVGYIKLSSFTQTAGSDFLNAFKELKGRGMEKLIFDLRGNGGGLVVEAVKIVNIFVEKGTEIVSIRGRDASVNQTYKAQLKPEDTDMPLVVLVDGGSASASEIVSGALQDLDRAVIVGQTSFGKGLVQRPLDLKYNAKVKVTIAKYYTPSGRCIQKLDYSHREQGAKAAEVSDSLLKKFYTKVGREVIDGRGIEPDVTVEFKEFSDLTKTIVLENILFDFATKFKREHPSIAPADEFKLTDEMYSDFESFAKAKEFEYTTEAMMWMKELEKFAEENKSGFEGAESEITALKNKIEPSISEDLKKYKSELIPLIEDEIVGRYYYEKGRIDHSLNEDDFIREGLEIFLENKRYKEVLKIQE